MNDILRSDAPSRDTEPAGRQATEPAPAAPAETGDKPDAHSKDERARDDAGRFAPKAAAPDTGPPPENKQDVPQTVPVAAVLEERKKRQAVEARLKELEARIAAPPPPAAPTASASPEVPLEDLMFQDPQRFIQAVRAPIEEQLVQTRIALSEQAARREADYDQAIDALNRHVEQSPPEVRNHVAATLRQHPDPARWAVEQGRAILAQQNWGQVIQQYGSPDAFLAAQRAAAPPVASHPSPPAPPASLASARSAGPRSGGAPWSGPTPLSQILGPRR